MVLKHYGNGTIDLLLQEVILLQKITLLKF
jgi:hypothetical protein